MTRALVRAAALAALCWLPAMSAWSGPVDVTSQVSITYTGYVYDPANHLPIYTALVSLLTERTVKSDTAMTGEISLRGLVLPVGGIKEKVVAAARAGLATVILPARNRKDYEEVPEAARNALRFVWAERVEEVIDAALEPAMEPTPAVAA